MGILGQGLGSVGSIVGDGKIHSGLGNPGKPNGNVQFASYETVAALLALERHVTRESRGILRLGSQQRMTVYSVPIAQALHSFSVQLYRNFQGHPREETSVKSPAENRLMAGIKSWRKRPHCRAVLGRTTKLFLTRLSALVSPASPAQFTPFGTQDLTRRLFPPHQRAAKPWDSGRSAPTRVKRLQQPHTTLCLLEGRVAAQDIGIQLIALPDRLDIPKTSPVSSQVWKRDMAPGHAEPHSWVHPHAVVRPTIVLEANELEVQLSLA